MLAWVQWVGLMKGRMIPEIRSGIGESLESMCATIFAATIFHSTIIFKRVFFERSLPNG